MKFPYYRKIIFIFTFLCLLTLIYKSFVIGLFKNDVDTSMKNLNKSEVQFSIQPEFNKYFRNQTIWIKVAIFNNLENPYQLNDPFGITGIKFDVIGPDKLPLENSILSVDYLPMKSVFVPGKDSAITYVNLDYFFFNLVQIKKKQVGEFMIKAKYQNLESNEVTILMENPSGEDKELFDETFEGYYLFSNNDQSMRLENLLEKYKTSPYAPQLYVQLYHFTPVENKSDTTRFKNLFKKYFENNTNSYSLVYLLQRYEGYLKSYMNLNKSQITEKLNELKNKYPGSFLEKSVDHNNFKINKGSRYFK